MVTELTLIQHALLDRIESENPDARVVSFTLDADLGVEPVVSRTDRKTTTRITRAGRMVRSPALA